ncbi:hypothetical protein EBR43_04780 [bacterium]|nr:hypothetical protein [bacterium]
MNKFSTIFSRLLNEELKSITEFTSWNPGINTLFYKEPKNPLNPTQRHRKIIKDPGFRKYAQTVPDMHKVDPKSIQAFNDLKVANSGRKALSQDEVQRLCKQFGISRLNANEPKKLGNTGVVMKFDPTLRGYVLLK